MRPGQDGELIFESTTEARVASEVFSQLASENMGGGYMEPPLENPRIGRIAFIIGVIKDRRETSEPQEYTIPGPFMSRSTTSGLRFAIAALDDVRPQHFPRLLTRRGYVERRLAEYAQKVKEQ
jgi:hypothetical protein